MPRTKEDLATALGSFIHKCFNVDIPAAAWQETALPDHLKLRYAIIDADGEELAVGRKQQVLQAFDPGLPQEVLLANARRQWECDGLTDWPVEDLPEQVVVGDDPKEAHTLFPALSVTGEERGDVGVRLYASHDQACRSHRKGVAALLKKRLAGELKFLKRQLRLPRDVAVRIRFEGGATGFEQQLLERVTHDLLHHDARTREAFEALAAEARSGLIGNGQALLQGVLPVLRTLDEVGEALYGMERRIAAKGPVADFLEARREEVQRLVPARFVHLYGKARFPHLVRYLRAIAIRAERALAQFDRDQAKAAESRRWEDQLKMMLDQLSPRSSENKRGALEELFWMIEEYKVSLFAQELKTAIPISAKRLEKKVAEIRRMR